MTGVVFEITLAAAGALIAIVGQLLPKDWQKRLAMLLGVLLFFGAVMSGLLDLFTVLLWGDSAQTAEVGEYEPGALLAELEEERAETLTAVASLAPETTPEELPTFISPTQTRAMPEVTESPQPTRTPRPSNTPRPTETPRPTLVPEPTATAVPTPTATVTRTPEPEPTPEERQRQKPTPEPDPLRLSRKTLDSRLRAIAVTDPNAVTQEMVFELAGHPAYNTLISAAWSPDGKRVLIAYRWATTRQDLGIVLRIINADGTGGRDVLAMPTGGLYRAVGNALWLPDGRILFYLLDGSHDGVWVINADGTGLRRLDSSAIGEWPRYLSVDGEWLITVSGDGSLHAVEIDGDRRVPFSSWGQEGIYDQRYYPWRFRRGPRCEVQEDSWWKCK